MARSGGPPRCADCGSLERHRALRACLNRVPREFLSWRHAIHFAPDRSLDPAWFRSYEGSVYGRENSIDLQDIDRPDGSYDFISLSSVLEFVPDDRRAFAELVRIGSSKCVIHCTFTPFANTEGRHFDRPHGAFGRYHVFGSDTNERFATRAHGLTTLVRVVTDPATQTEESLHFFCRRVGDTEALS